MNPDKIIGEKKDILGRKKFAEEISDALINYSSKNTDGITISITGEWGSGKSTLLSFLKDDLKEKNKQAIIIEFNPWIFYNEATIREAFLIHFALALKDFETHTFSIAKRVRDFISAFRFLKYLNPVAGDLQAGLEEVFEFYSNNNSIPEIKGEIEKILKKSKKKIFILIDDVDRLSQSEILELMQMISLVMNFSNVFYIIAFDKEIIEAALYKEYGNRNSDYLEKIIQVDYSLPLIRKEKLEFLFEKKLIDLCDFHDIRFDKNSGINSIWNFHGLSEYFKTIRDFNRYFNSLSLRLPLVADEVNVNDFLILEAIRLFDNNAYHSLYQFYSTNLRKRELPELIFNDTQISNFRQPTLDIIKALLPKSSLASFRSDTNSKRLLDSSYFERYFSLLRNDNDIKQKDIEEFINHPQLRGNLLEVAFRENTIDNLISRFGDYNISKHFPNYDYDVINELIKFYDKHQKSFEIQSERISNTIINLICSSKQKEEFLKKFFYSFKNGSSSIVRLYFFHFMRKFKAENRCFDSRNPDFDRYYKQHFENIYMWCINNLVESMPMLLDSRFSIECPDIKYYLFKDFAEIFPDRYANILKGLMQDKVFVIFILTKFLWLSDDFEVQRIDTRDKDILFPNSTFQEFYKVVDQLDHFDLTKRDKVYVEFFLKKFRDNAS